MRLGKETRKKEQGRGGGSNIRVIHHFFKQSQNETAVLNVFRDLKPKISEQLDQN